ncbi:Nardilysin [Schistosoma japonicum]|uniref:Nardilysin n=1 Tax=Schistosoma japonicum TaxID=6182 RepID=A0A4Z2DBF1_SCHJA|nr:Nardilysin [Schistosoma japonicum]
MTIEYENGIELSHKDKRFYRHFELQNGMKVMIISAPDDDDNGGDNSMKSDTLSAAALCIKVGSFYDPQAAQGLSHLLEHMLFHNDNDQYTFHNYIHQHNGYWNSKTSNEHTIFYFSISNRYFNEAIDLFVKHFMYPTLNVDGMRKSIEKIDMEFQKLKTRDYAKLRGFISSLAVKGSPYRLFGRGNKLSLISEPEKNGINVNELLMKHWSTLYSSHRMTLAVQSKDSLNTLERIVREKFSSIPANRSMKLDLSRYANSFDSPDFFKLYHVDSTRNKEQLRMVWAVPSVCALYKSNPIAVLGYFLSDKHPYGLENYLKNNHLATEVKCEFSAMSDFDNSTICAIITICIDLNGTRTDYFKITKVVYEYLRFLSNKANETYGNKFFNESNNTTNNSNHNHTNTTTTTTINNNNNHYYYYHHNNSSNNNVKSTFDSCVRDFQLAQKEAFQCRTIFGPQETVIWIANMLHHTQPQDVHSAYLTIKQLDYQVYSELLDTLSKQQACLIHSSKLNTTMHRNIHTEKWYNLQYTQEDVSMKQIGCIDDSYGTVPFSLPLKVNGSTHEYSTFPSENETHMNCKFTTYLRSK